MRGEVFGGDVEGSRGVGLLDRNVDAADPCAIHAGVGDEVTACVGYGDVHGLANLCGLYFSGLDNALCVFQCDHLVLPQIGLTSYFAVSMWGFSQKGDVVLKK